MADVNGLIRDPTFQALPFNQRRQLLSEADPDFAQAAPNHQIQLLNEMKQQDWWQGGASKTTAAPASDNKFQFNRKVYQDAQGNYTALPTSLANYGERVGENFRTAGNIISRAPGDLWDIAKGIGKAIIHPIDTLEGLNSLGAGAIQSGLRAVGVPQQNLTDIMNQAMPQLASWRALRGQEPIGPQDEQVFDKAIVQPIKSAYNLATTDPMEAGAQLGEYMVNNPVKTALNISAGAGTLGKGAELAGLGRTASTLKGISTAFATPATAPLELAGAMGSKGLSMLANTQLPERLYGSAVKLPLSAKWKKALDPEGLTMRKLAVQAGLEGEILPTELGLQQARNLESKYRNIVDSAVSDLDTTGATISESRLMSGLAKARETAMLEGTPQALNFVNRLEEKLRQIGRGLGKVEQGAPEVDAFGVPVQKLERVFTPSEVQTIKRHLYKQANYESKRPARGINSQIREAGVKGVANQAMSALEELNPELKMMNQKDAAYIALQEALESAVPRIENSNIFGLGAKALASGNTSLGILDQVLGLPKVKARLAFAINKARNVVKAKNGGPNIANPTMTPPIVNSPLPSENPMLSGWGKVNTMPNPEPPPLPFGFGQVNTMGPPGGSSPIPGKMDLSLLGKKRTL